MDTMERRTSNLEHERAEEYAAKLVVDIPGDHPMRALLEEFYFYDYYYRHGCREEDLLTQLRDLSEKLDALSFDPPELRDPDE